MRAVRGLPGFRHFFGSRRGGGHGAGITSDRKDGPVGEMSDDEASSAAAAHGKKLVGDMEDEMDLDNECCICLIDMEERKFRGKMDCCDHVVCWCCIQEWAQTSRSCPICQRSYNKCKKTLPKAKKGRKHAKPNGAKGKKQRSLWEKVGGGILGRRLRSARSSPAQPEQQAPNLAAQSSWGDGMGDEEADVDAGDEEVVVFPVRDSRGDDDDDVGAAAAAVDGAAAVAADASSSSSGSSDDSDSRRSRRSNEEEANEEGNDAIIVNIINDDSPAEQAEEEEEEEAAVEASRVDEAVAVAVNQAGVSSSSLSTLSLYTSSVSTRDVSDEETYADNKNEEEEETTTSGNNFIAEGADRKDKGKELEDEDEDEEDEEEEEDEDEDGDKDTEEEEWERKDSESDDSDDDEDDASNGPLDSY